MDSGAPSVRLRKNVSRTPPSEDRFFFRKAKHTKRPPNVLGPEHIVLKTWIINPLAAVKAAFIFFFI
jgi:hypothetical protein